MKRTYPGESGPDKKPRWDLQDTLREEVLLLLERHPASWKPDHGFPMPMPKSIGRSDLALLTREDYWFCEKSDGETAVLYIRAQEANGKVYLIDRKFQFKALDAPAYVDAWKGGVTLMVGEWVSDSLLLFDLLMLQNEPIWKSYKTLSQRLERIQKDVLPKSQTVPFPIKAKRFRRKDLAAQDIFANMKQVAPGQYVYDDGVQKNANDGAIATPEHGTFFAPKTPILKWKWPGLHTIDFRVQAPWYDQKTGHLKLWIPGVTAHPEGRQLHPSDVFRYMHVLSTPLDAATKSWFDKSIVGRTSSIVECAYEPSQSQWKLKRFRHDKSNANMALTCFSTMMHMVDNVSLEDIVHVCSSKSTDSKGQPT